MNLLIMREGKRQGIRYLMGIGMIMTLERGERREGGNNYEYPHNYTYMSISSMS